MKYLLFICFLVSYTAGFANLTLSLIVFLRYRIRTLLYYMIFITAFTGMLIVNSLVFYRTTILFIFDTYLNTLMVFIHHLFFAVMILSMPLYFHKFLNISFSFFQKIIFGLSSVFSIVIVFIPLFFRYTRIRTDEIVIFGFKIIPWIMFSIIFYIFIISFIQLKKIRIKEKKTILISILILNVVFLPVFLLEYNLNFNPMIFLKPLPLSNLYYFTFNLLNIIFTAKYILFNDNRISAEEIPEEAVKNYGITPREKEIIGMIAKGYTNKMMAKALGIAFMTVKNHVYNIYQKTEAESKIDLINKMNSGRQTAKSRIISILS